ncbi:MAG: NAD(+) synthase [Pseudomonadales bacterium]|jgi:NAD+ synthase (glutamine-hydrolysing)|nr:NAD(+) synthase [Pseudomonadales bacterium]
MADDLRRHGFLRCMAFAPPLQLADPRGNVDALLARIEQAAAQDASIVLFPELCLTGFTCEDLFFSRALLDGARAALAELLTRTRHLPQAIVVGAPWALDDGRLLNCALVLAEGRICGAVPKQHLPNYGEFYDMRWFAPGTGIDLEIEDAEFGRFPLAAAQLFETGGVRWALELCEDLWAPEPPGARHALAGALLVLNPSASNELVAKADYRRDLVRMNSAQRICAYLYASAGPLESTKDLVFGGHLLAAENGVTLGESERFAFEGSELVVDFDIEHLRHDRLQHTTFRTAPRPAPYPVRAAGAGAAFTALGRAISRHPFVPDDLETVDARAREILAIQATGLARRMRASGSEGLILGLSGGLDSTLAFLVALDALRLQGRDLALLHAITMPGPGTGERTLAAARALATAAAVDLREVPIHAAVAQHLSDLGHAPDLHDVTFENAQARERTQLLFDFANQLGGLVVGTGDLSELALGWCTYNGDHMSSYNVNVSVPKTMIAYLVRWYARHRAPQPLAAVLEEVLEIPISPELVPGAEDAGVAQHTEALIGPYELHDFFLFHYVRGGASPERIRFLARTAFAGVYETEVVDRWLREFLVRFHRAQFKRTALPPGPKVGSVSLSPRGDWRMPDETLPPA